MKESRERKYRLESSETGLRSRWAKILQQGRGSIAPVSLHLTMAKGMAESEAQR